MDWESEHLDSAFTWGGMKEIFWPHPLDCLGLLTYQQNERLDEKKKNKKQTLFQLDKSVILDSVFV